MIESLLPDLPIHEVLPDLLAALDKGKNAVLVAPPGAGKTTIVPLALLEAPWRTSTGKSRKIVVLEPRRLAARAAATQMARLLGEQSGERVGYRVRFDTKISAKTEIEVVTEGVFNRMLNADPMLEDVAVVLFDEFHERSLDGDLALALCLDSQSGLREDLRLLPMSATLDGAAIAKLLNATVIESKGRQFPVSISYRDRPPREPIETTMALAVQNAIIDHDVGDILAFLPGQREIERCYERLNELLSPKVHLHRLYGAISQKQQDAAIAPAPNGHRKVILASAIAETSLTINGVTIVIDSGLARQSVYEPATGLTRLETVRASKAQIAQRAGRAGRLQAGHAIRLWREQQTAALAAYAPPEILNADLASLVLDLAQWGLSRPDDLLWLDPPPAASLKEAIALLRDIGAFGDNETAAQSVETTWSRLSDHGKRLHELPLPPRLAHMVLKAAASHQSKEAALLALLIQERGTGGNNLDLTERLEKLKNARSTREQKLLNAASTLAKNLPSTQVSRSSEKQIAKPVSAGVLLAFAFPDRVAQRGATRDGRVRYKLANGRGVELDATEPLAGSAFIVVVDMAGRAGAARVLSAAAITLDEILIHFDDRLADKQSTRYNPDTHRLECNRATQFGALQLSASTPTKPNPEVALAGLLEAARQHGLNLLPWQPKDLLLRGRLSFLHGHDAPRWPRQDDIALLSDLEIWLAPFLTGETSFHHLNRGQLSDGLLLRVQANEALTSHQLDSLLPGHFTAPSGSHLPIAYEEDKAVLRVRPQELFGLSRHPTVMDGAVAMEVELLSPAGRPIQITRDLPGFWAGSWRDVRADLRGRYPRHPWPEDPSTAEPTRRAKKKGH